MEEEKETLLAEVGEVAAQLGAGEVAVVASEREVGVDH